MAAYHSREGYPSNKNNVSFCSQKAQWSILAILLIVVSSYNPLLSAEDLVDKPGSYLSETIPTNDAQTIGGNHLGFDNYWVRPSHNISASDWDGDGIENSQDRFPTDFARPAKDQFKRIHCPENAMLVCNDNVGFQLSSQPISALDSLDFPLVSKWVDFDGDGDHDLAISAVDKINIYLNSNGIISETPAFAYNLNKMAFAMDWADMDSDGDLDLLVGNIPDLNLDTMTFGSQGGHNNVFINDGDGLLPGPIWSNNASGRITSTVAWADVNGDGLLDAFFGNRDIFEGDGTNPNLNNPLLQNHIYLNDGNGSLMNNPWWTGSSTYSTIGVEFADIDNDGDNDMVVTNDATHLSNGTTWGGWVEYFENDGGFDATPTWRNSSSLDVGTRAAGVLSDYDGDGDLDLAIGKENGAVIILKFTDGTFEDVISWTNCEITSSGLSGDCDVRNGPISWGDMDQDGDDDLVMMTESGQGSCIYLNLGSNLSVEPAWCDSSDGRWNSMDLGDIDGDGDLDILRSSLGDGEVQIILNSVLTTNNLVSFGSWDASSVTQIEGDTESCEQDQNGTVSCFYSSFEQDIPEEQRYLSSGVANLDSDDHLEYIISGDNSFYYINLERCIIIIDENPCTNSFNGTKGQLFKFFDTDEGSSKGQMISYDQSADAFAIGDLDGDGDMDIVGGNRNQFSSYIQGDNTSFPVPGLDNYTFNNGFSTYNWNNSGFGDNVGLTAMALEDIDGDGDLDLAMSFSYYGNASGPAVCVHRNTDGLGNFSDLPDWCGLNQTTGHDLSWGDFDGDGDPDLAVASEHSPVVIFLNNNPGFTKLELNSPNCLDNCMLYAVEWADIDNDGDLDLTAGGQMTKIVSFYNVNGTLSTSNSRTLDDRIDARDFAVADIDRNGYLDLLVATRNSGDMIYLNHGGRLADTHSWIDSENLATHTSISAVDWDNDGGINLFVSGESEALMLGVAFDNDGDMKADIDYDTVGTGLDDPSLDYLPVDPTQWEDGDLDGYGEESTGMTPDSCQNIWGESWRDRWGCADEDSDGQSNLYDDFWIKDTQWIDTDGDGLGDNFGNQNWLSQREVHWPGEFIMGAYNPDPSPMDRDNDGFEDADLFAINTSGNFDDCPFTFGKSRFDQFGCADGDKDGWSDDYDVFPGDMSQWNDSDSDGYGDNLVGYMGDACQEIAGTSTEDVFGCPDNDGDGWSNFNDMDDDDPNEWNDFDGDGFGDNSDNCPSEYGVIPTGDDRGCPDLDQDGVADRSDAFPGNPAQWGDADDDGFGDNHLAEIYDYCPDEQGTSFRVQIFGCIDSDNDGFADDIEDCDDVPGLSRIAMLGCPDSDGDGLPDEVDFYPGPHGGTATDYDGDGVENIEDEFQYDRTQTTDTDGDGRGDNQSIGATTPDQFIDAPNAWDDSDGDGFTDQLGNPNTDDCPSIPGNSTTPWRGCPDIDGDGIMDLTDKDADGDGILDSYEEQAGGALGIAYDIYDPNSAPDDLDGDGMPDILDEDTDGDGFPDDLEEQRGSDSMDANQTPMNMYGNSDYGFYYIPGDGFKTGYEPDGYEVSASMFIDLATSEFLFPIILLPLSMMMVMRKGRRYKKMKKSLENFDDVTLVSDFETEIDDLIAKKKVKLEHGILLRNQFERIRDDLEKQQSNVQRREPPSNRNW